MSSAWTPSRAARTVYPAFRQTFRRQRQESFLILHQQDRACSRMFPHGNLIVCGSRNEISFVCGRKILNEEPFPGSESTDNAAAALLAPRRKPLPAQACSLPKALGGEEWLENVPSSGCIHSDARVGHVEEHIGPRLKKRQAGSQGLCSHPNSRFQSESCRHPALHRGHSPQD